jgi:hypothetical protein
MLKKMRNWEFGMQLALLRDCLQILQFLSLYLQQRDASILTARDRIRTALTSLKALKTANGLSLQEFANQFDSAGTFQGVAIGAPTERMRDSFANTRSQFCQALLDNISARFPDQDLLSAGAVLSPQAWPECDVERAFFGDREVQKLAEMCSLDAAAAIDEFRQYKTNCKRIGSTLQKLLLCSHLFAISSAECERGFSAMNLNCTALRNQLDIATLSAVLFIKVNGPPPHQFDAEHYARQWLNTGRHAPTDKLTGKKKKGPEKISPISSIF